MTKDFIQHTDKQALESHIIRTFIGIPYKYKGRTMAALDCWGLLLALYDQLGVQLFDVPSIDYSDTDWSNKGGNFLAENVWRDWNDVEKPEMLDAILFKNVEGVSRHCGVMLLENRFIHCGKHGVQVGRLTGAWKDLVAGYYRLRKLHE